MADVDDSSKLTYEEKELITRWVNADVYDSSSFTDGEKDIILRLFKTDINNSYVYFEEKSVTFDTPIEVNNNTMPSLLEDLLRVYDFQTLIKAKIFNSQCSYQLVPFSDRNTFKLVQPAR